MKKNKTEIARAKLKDTEEIRALFKHIDGQHARLLPKHFKNLKGGRSDREISSLINEKSALCLLGKIDGKIVGIITAKLKHTPAIEIIRRTKFVSIENLIVDPEYRKKGLGKSLLLEVEKWAKKKKAIRVSLNVYAKNTEAVKFYGQTKYEPVSIRFEKTIK